MVTDQQREAAEERLAGFLRLPYGVKKDVDGSWYNVGPRWSKKPTEMLELLLQHTEGYYETRVGSTEHAIVVASMVKAVDVSSTVVYLRDHPNKSMALAYAVVLAATAKFEHEARLKRRARAQVMRSAESESAVTA